MGTSKTSEEKLGINKPPEFVCPRIDEVMEDLNMWYCILNREALSDQDQAQLSLFIADMMNDMENFRTTIEEIRVWGQSWKDLSKHEIVGI